MSLGTNIYNLRKEKGYSQEELASRCNVSRQAISKWEADEVMPDTNNLLTLSKLFNITIDELINNTVQSRQPDFFDKSVNLVKKHWAKIGYYFIFGGAGLIGFSFLTRMITRAFFKTMDVGFSDFIGNDVPPLFDGNVHLVTDQEKMFNLFSNFALIVGMIALIGGLVLVIFDYNKNHKKG